MKPEFCYGPEVYALHEHLRSFHSDKIFSQVLSLNELKLRQSEFDVVYRMMGFSPSIFKDFKLPEIHDYASLSTGNFCFLKNIIKRNIQKKPIFRTFLNKNVFEEFKFNDGVQYGLRDMGVSKIFFNKYTFDYDNKDFDFCYVGEISYERKIDVLINEFLEQEYKVLFIGENKTNYKSCEKLHFYGKVSNSEIPKLVNKCRFALNFIPNKYPYNLQTSTKCLEYAAIGIPIISNSYNWVEGFSYSNNIDILFLNMNKISDFNLHDFYFNSAKKCSSINIRNWDQIFEESGLIEFMLNLGVCEK
ncbi:MAG: hypothetical protein RR923_06015 [Bacilli bacterium]